MNDERGTAMIRPIKAEFTPDGEKKYFEFAGLSSDTKPTGDLYSTGSLFLEVDTGDVYAYDEAGAEWGKVASLGGDA